MLFYKLPVTTIKKKRLPKHLKTNPWHPYSWQYISPRPKPKWLVPKCKASSSSLDKRSYMPADDFLRGLRRGMVENTPPIHVRKVIALVNQVECLLNQGLPWDEICKQTNDPHALNNFYGRKQLLDKDKLETPRAFMCRHCGATVMVNYKSDTRALFCSDKCRKLETAHSYRRGKRGVNNE